MMEDGHGHPPWSSDAGRSWVVSSDLNHSYLETLNIAGALTAFGRNTVTGINVSAGIIGLWGRKTEDMTKRQMFSNVFPYRTVNILVQETAE